MNPERDASTFVVNRILKWRGVFVASLMENLMDVLEKENAEYEKLLELSMKKTPVIVDGNVNKLQEIMDEEADVLNRVNHFDNLRSVAMQDIANVLNKDVENLKLLDLVEMLQQRPEEANRLSDIREKLQVTMKNMVRVNNQNKELLKNALELVEFDMNVMQALRGAPETANYDSGAYSTGAVIGNMQVSFDAKQ